MSTISSKSRNKKSGAAANKDPAAPNFSSDAAVATSSDISETTWRLAAAAILIVGTILRLFYLNLVPLHHDEGVNGNFLVTLVRDGKYVYDPQNYHGPTLYFFSSLIPWLARFLGGVQARDAYGLTTFNIRLVTALFGIATIWLALMLRKRLGSIGALSAAALITISPGAIYLSRYFIHETLFVFFTLGIMVAVLRYYDTANSVYMILAAISAGLMVATKETWIINGPVLLIAFATTQLYFLLRQKLGNRNSVEEALPPEPSSPSSLVANVTLMAFAMFLALTILFIASFNESKNNIWIWISVVGLIGATLYFVLQTKRRDADGNVESQTDSAFARFGGAVPFTTVALVALAVFILVNVLFYSSFFTNYPKGVSDALKTLNLWRQRTHEHEHPWYQYAYWLLWEEGIVVVLSGLGALIAVWRARNRLAVFLALWSFGLLTAYSIAGMSVTRLLSDLFLHHTITEQTYKTPWISLNFVVPMALTAGYALQFAYDKLREYHAAALAPVMAVVIIAFCGYQLYQLNFVHYDDDQLPYVYAHTKRDMLKMIDRIESIAQKNGTGTDTGVAIVSPDYWPLPWYFRNYKKVGYYAQIVPTTEPIIIGSKAQEDQLTAQYSDRYDVINSGADDGAYPLRPGVDLLLLVRRDVKR
jgi:predicted membrane-bound mannosyltransferase